MPGLLSDVDPDGLLEYSVVYTDRAVNHMSGVFQAVMNDISATLKRVYNADAAVDGAWKRYVWHGSGRTAVCDRQEMPDRSKRLFQLPLDADSGDGRYCGFVNCHEGPQNFAEDREAPFAPAPIEEVVATIAEQKPDVVFAPHVETSSGMLLPDDYLRAVTTAVHDHGGLFVLDCIASGTIWVDMKAIGVDVLVSAPQKGWSGSPCAAFIALE